MIDVRYERGVWVPEAALWLDPQHPVEAAFVSHAHSDHTGRHRRIFCTPATRDLMRARMNVAAEAFHVAAYHVPIEAGGCRCELLPAGHVLGSAQLFLEGAGGSLLYTGDFKRRPGLSSEPAEARHAETLIIETTYGLPRYQFPPTDETLRAVVQFCHDAIEDGASPVLFGYALGKAQEILAALTGAGLPVMLHSSVAKLTTVYESLGVSFPAYSPYTAEGVDGHVVICPPGANGSRMIAKIPNARTAALTGWAMDPAAVHRLRVDAAFPLSDHADYNDLLTHVQDVAPKRVLTLHGYAAEFARDLRARGIEAWSLTSADQLELLTLPDPPPVVAAPPANNDVSTDGFGAFCGVCAAVAATTGKTKKTILLADYLANLDGDDLSLAARWLGGRTFPRTDPRPMNVGWAAIKRALAIASKLPDGEVRRIARLRNDAGIAATEILSNNPGRANPALGEIAEFFRRLRDLRGPTAKISLLADRLVSLPPRAAGFVVRLLTGDLRIGLREGLVEEAVARAFGPSGQAVREAHMLTGDIGVTSVLARNGTLQKAELRLFCPVKCMLAGPEPTAEAVWERLGGNGPVWVEEKFDGIRAQVHVGDGRVRIFSRELRDLTDTFPEIVDAFREYRGAAVLDGEILAWDGGPAGFSQLQRRLGRTGGDLFLGGEIAIHLRVFDLLHHDGTELIRLPLRERRRMLEELPLPKDVVSVAPVRFADSATKIDALFDQARAAGFEGLMIKDPSSVYSPGRRGLAWIKLKKAFATLDTVIVAAEFGHGKRSGVLSDYTFAVRDEGRLVTIGKAYSGLTDAEIASLTERLHALTIRREGNRFTVRPEVVLEIAFDSLQPSNRHESGLAMRFPRIVRIRDDKTVDAADTLATARRLAGT